MVNLESLTNKELRTYAKEKYDLNLSENLTKAQLVSQIEAVEESTVSQDDKVADLEAQIKELKAMLKGANLNPNINTSKSIYTPNEEKALFKAMGEYAKKFQKEEKVDISIPMAYAKHIGKVLTVRVKGANITIPVDSKTYQINKTHAEHIKRILRGYDRSVFNAPAKDIKQVD